MRSPCLPQILKKENLSSKSKREESEAEQVSASADVKSPLPSSSSSHGLVSPLSHFQWESPAKRPPPHQQERTQASPVRSVQGKKKRRRESEQDFQEAEAATAMDSSPNRQRKRERGGGGRIGRGIGRGRGRGGGKKSGRRGEVGRSSSSSSAYFEQAELTTDKDMTEVASDEDEDESDSDEEYSPSQSPAAKRKSKGGRRMSKRLAERLASLCEEGHPLQSRSTAVGRVGRGRTEDGGDLRKRNNEKRLSGEVEEEGGSGSQAPKKRRRGEKGEKHSSTGGEAAAMKWRGHKDHCVAGDDSRGSNPRKGGVLFPEKGRVQGSIREQVERATFSPQDEVGRKDSHVPHVDICSLASSGEEEDGKAGFSLYGEVIGWHNPELC